MINIGNGNVGKAKDGGLNNVLQVGNRNMRFCDRRASNLIQIGDDNNLVHGAYGAC